MNIEKRGFQMNNTLDEMGFTRPNKTVFEANKSDIERLQKLAQKRTRMADFKNGKLKRYSTIVWQKAWQKFQFELLNKKGFFPRKSDKKPCRKNKTVKEIVENYLGKKAVSAGCGLWYSKPSGKRALQKSAISLRPWVPRTRLKIFIPLKKSLGKVEPFAFLMRCLLQKLRGDWDCRENIWMMKFL